jgi:hypothetical protein
MAELVNGATLVFAGTPLESRSLWEGDASSHGRRIVTYTRVRVDRLLDGKGQEEVWIRTLGGEVGDIGQQVAGEAVLRAGEPSLFFLHDRPDGSHFVVGMSQGQFLLEGRGDNGAVKVRAPMAGAQLVPKKGRGATSSSATARAVIIGHTLDEIAELVAAERRAHAP